MTVLTGNNDISQHKRERAFAFAKGFCARRHERHERAQMAKAGSSFKEVRR